MRTTRALTLLGFAAVTLGAGGCTKHQTELIFVVATEGVRIPEDIHKIHVKVADRRQGSLDDTIYEADVELCNANLTTSCHDIPVTGVLFPGPSHGTDSVRMEVDAIGANGIVIADAALFTFAEEQSLRLDFVLYANCLGNVDCAVRDQACGPLDTCIDLHPGQTNGALDLAFGSEDMTMSLPPDMTMVDLAGADLISVPPDLTSTLDMAGCAGVTCDMGEQCVAGVCQPCGNYRDPCCFSMTASPGNGTCNQPNLTCNGSICVLCGSDTQLCCPNMVPMCLSPDVCTSGTCQMPPVDDMAMGGGQDMGLTVSDMGIGGPIDLF